MEIERIGNDMSNKEALVKSIKSTFLIVLCFLLFRCHLSYFYIGNEWFKYSRENTESAMYFTGPIEYARKIVLRYDTMEAIRRIK